MYGMPAPGILLGSRLMGYFPLVRRTQWGGGGVAVVVGYGGNERSMMNRIIIIIVIVGELTAMTHCMVRS